MREEHGYAAHWSGVYARATSHRGNVRVAAGEFAFFDTFLFLGDPGNFCSIAFHPQRQRGALSQRVGGRFGSVSIIGRSFDRAYKAITTAPAVTNAPPTTTFHDIGSLRKMIASTMAKTTLSLSMGATREAGPN